MKFPIGLVPIPLKVMRVIVGMDRLSQMGLLLTMSISWCDFEP